MKKAVAYILWFGGLGCLPFWVALVWLLVNGIGEGDDYWVAAPWVVVIAIPLSVVTLAMAAVTFKVYVATSGDAFRKLRYAGGCYAALWAAVVAIGASIRSEHKADEATLEAQRAEGQALVERSPFLATVAPRRFRVSPYMWSTNRDGTASRLYYSVYPVDDPTDSLVVVVEPARDSPARELAIRCIVPTEAYREAAARADPCELRESIQPE